MLRSPALLDRFLKDIAHRLRAISTRETAAKDEHRHLRRVLESLQPPLTAFETHPRLSVEVRSQPRTFASGDYYDVLVRPDGRVYFIIADVSGKGVTAALVMSGLATAFNIFTRSDPAPADLVRELNVTLAPKTAPTKFATLVAGVLNPEDGVIDFTNAGHVPPLVISSSGISRLGVTDLVVGLFPQAQYRNQSIRLESGDSLVLFTDGVTEAENVKEEQLGLDAVEWARRLVELGVGEILLTSMDRDGARSGFDLGLTRAIVDAVDVPVIASGGVGALRDLVDGILEGGADAVLAASIFHYGEFTIGEAKAVMAAAGIEIRPTP